MRKLPALLIAAAAVPAIALGTACSGDSPHPGAPTHGGQPTAEYYGNEPSLPHEDNWVPPDPTTAEEAPVSAYALGESALVSDYAGTVKVTVSDFQVRPSELWGATQAVLVTVEGVEGNPWYNELYFKAETADHFRLNTEIVDDPQLGSGQLQTGEVKRGWIGFDPAQPITAIHVTDSSMSSTAASWTVR